MPDKNVIPNGPYTVRQLIEALQKCKNPDAPVYVYLLDSEGADTEYHPCCRYPLGYVDDNFENNRLVDLNVDSTFDLENYTGCSY